MGSQSYILWFLILNDFPLFFSVLAGLCFDFKEQSFVNAYERELYSLR
jgi:hypothetical protein